MPKKTLLIVLALLACGNVQAVETDARTAYEALSALAGSWQSAPGDGNPHTISIRSTAAGSALVETWTLSPARESMTIYAIDGDRLLATHYCPQGNQPRLQYVGRDDKGHYRFDFLDGTGLQDPEASHQASFWIDIEGPDRFVRSEHYVSNDSADDSGNGEDDEPVTYIRMPAP